MQLGFAAFKESGRLRFSFVLRNLLFPFNKDRLAAEYTVRKRAVVNEGGVVGKSLCSVVHTVGKVPCVFLCAESQR